MNDFTVYSFQCLSHEFIYSRSVYVIGIYLIIYYFLIKYNLTDIFFLVFRILKSIISEIYLP